MCSVKRKTPRGVVFFSGCHGVGKTYMTNALLDTFDAKIVDCGPTIRHAFTQSGHESFDIWAKGMECKLGARWDDEILLMNIMDNVDSEQLLFVVGNRDIDTILFLAEKIPHQMPAAIIYLEKPIEVMKRGYELRTKTALTNEEFEKILRSGPDARLGGIRQYVLNHPANCRFIYEEDYGDLSVAIVKDFINEIYR